MTTTEHETKWQTVTIDGKTYRASVHFGCYWRLVNGKPFGGTKDLGPTAVPGTVTHAVWLAVTTPNTESE